MASGLGGGKVLLSSKRFLSTEILSFLAKDLVELNCSSGGTYVATKTGKLAEVDACGENLMRGVELETPLNPEERLSV